MPLYTAQKTIYYTSTESIKLDETFDPADKGISAKDVATLLGSKAIVIVPGVSKPVTQEVKRPNVKDTLALIAAAKDNEALDELTAGEDRAGVLPALESRRLELAE